MIRENNKGLKMAKKTIKVIYLPNQYDEKSFKEGCRELLKLVALAKEGGD